MKLSNLFIGRPVYWILAAAIIVGLAVLGINQMHVKSFVPFQFIVMGIAAVAVAVVLVVYKPGERATRDPMNPDDIG
ncbi:hypothetical protein [Hwanghaeella sp.]|uniref:hypothetical protein n=1 Tax=Hwanghaeella sp. TaxID=2605943 RepID=UPI003CCBA38C